MGEVERQPAHLLQGRRERVKEALDEHLGEKLDGELVAMLAHDCFRSLHFVGKAPGADRQMKAIRDTLMTFHGTCLEDDTTDDIAVRLAGNFDRLEKGVAVLPFVGLDKAYWTTVEITEAKYGRIMRRKLYIEMEFRVLEGPAASERISVQLGHRYVMIRLAHTLGWARRDKRPIHAEMVKMRASGHLVSDEKTGNPTFDEFDISESMKKANRRLRERRNQACEYGRPLPCYSCLVGYDRCSNRGTHPYTFIQKACPKCGEDTFFDPRTSQLSGQICLRCQTKKARQIARMEDFS